MLTLSPIRSPSLSSKPPTIALTKDPEQQNRGSLLLSYRIEDDYGAIEAHATFARKDEPAAKKTTARVHCTGRPISRWSCRRRGRRTASVRP